MPYGLYKYIFNYLFSQQQLQVKLGAWVVQNEHLFPAELDCEKTIFQNFPWQWHRKTVRADLSSEMLSAAALRQVSLRKCDTKYLRRQPGPGGTELRELSGSATHCASHGDWEVHFPKAWIPKVGSGAPDLCLIFWTALCNSHAHGEIMKRIIYPALQIPPWPGLVVPSWACSVGPSQPWARTQELPKEQLFTSLFPSRLRPRHREGAYFERKRSKMHAQGMHLT